MIIEVLSFAHTVAAVHPLLYPGEPAVMVVGPGGTTRKKKRPLLSA